MGAQAVRIDTHGTAECIELGCDPHSRIREVIGCRGIECVRLRGDLVMWVGQAGGRRTRW